MNNCHEKRKLYTFTLTHVAHFQLV